VLFDILNNENNILKNYSFSHLHTHENEVPQDMNEHERKILLIF
jgi:hypothetical protein